MRCNAPCVLTAETMFSEKASPLPELELLPVVISSRIRNPGKHLGAESAHASFMQKYHS